ncbi:MAG: YlbF family regulator [Bryobacteraceae bacterium]
MSASEANGPRPLDPQSAALDAARALGRALEQSPEFKSFEAAHSALQADSEARRKLSEFLSHRQELRMASMFRSAEEVEVEQLEQDWQQLCEMPSIRFYLRAQENLIALLRQAAARISEQTGLDYGAACSPSGGS